VIDFAVILAVILVYRKVIDRVAIGDDALTRSFSPGLASSTSSER
jgi:hypothetical protein